MGQNWYQSLGNDLFVLRKSLNLNQLAEIYLIRDDYTPMASTWMKAIGVMTTLNGRFLSCYGCERIHQAAEV